MGHVVDMHPPLLRVCSAMDISPIKGSGTQILVVKPLVLALVARICINQAAARRVGPCQVLANS